MICGPAWNFGPSKPLSAEKFIKQLLTLLILFLCAQQPASASASHCTPSPASSEGPGMKTSMKN
ncbi:hypothetical protein LEMLEM_LOCUS7562 [Lemmus lemmus]